MTATRRVATASAPRVAPSHRMAKRRRGPNWPLVCLVALASGLLLIGARTIFGGVDPAEFVEDDLTPLAERSAAVGEALAQFKAEPSGSAFVVGDNDKPATEVLSDWADEAARISVEASQLVPPEDLIEAHRSFVLSMQARATAVTRLSDLIGRVVTEGGDPNDVTAEMMDIERDIVTGDRAYAYTQKAVEEAASGASEAFALPDAYWFPDPAETERPAVALFVRKLLDAPDVSGVVDVAVLTLTTVPEPTTVQDGVAVVASTDDFQLKVSFKNLGDQAVEKLAVKASLRPQGATDTQKASVEVTTLTPGEVREVTIPRLLPAEGSNRVTVSLGPLPGEQNVQDNIQSMSIDYAS